MRQLLFGLLFISACGRSTLGARPDSGVPDQGAAEPTPTADGSAQAFEASVDRLATETASPCRYEATRDFYVASCRGRFQSITQMSAGQTGCAAYFVHPESGELFDMGANGCVPCLWEASEWDVSDGCGMTNTIVGYASHLLQCPPLTIWRSSVDGVFYASRDEARATLPVCPDGGT